MDTKSAAAQLLNYLGNNPQLISQFVEHPYSTTAKATGTDERISKDDMSQVLTQVAAQVMGNDMTIGLCASQGQFELNDFMPVLAYNFLQSTRLLADAIRSFDERCAKGIEPIRERMDENLHRSLMLVTCLNPYIGYENAAKVAHKAFDEGTSLWDACVELGFLTPERFDEVFHPEEMV